MAAECLSPELAQKKISAAAQEAVRRFLGGQAPEPLRLELPVTSVLELVTSDMADRVAILPGASRLEGRRIELTADDVPGAYRALRAAIALAA